MGIFPTVNQELRKLDKVSGVQTGFTGAGIMFEKQSINRQRTIMAFWNSQCTIMFFNLTSFTLMDTINPTTTPVNSVTKVITFSYDSSLVII